MALVLVVGGGDARLAPVDRHRLLPASSRPSSGRCCSRSSSRASSPTVSARAPRSSCRCRRSALAARPDRARVPPAGPRHGARLRRGARRGALRRGHPLAPPRRDRSSWSPSGSRRSCGGCPAAGVNVLKPYQATRLTGFTHPDSDPRGATYNVNQSITAVGAGGLRGRGVAGATQTRLELPAGARDGLRLRLARRAARLRRRVDPAPAVPARRLARAEDRRPARATSSAPSLAGGLVFAFLFQVFVNVGMTIGIAPITGIPLPFVSVGGSSMITNLVAMGILLGDPRTFGCRRRA